MNDEAAVPEEASEDSTGKFVHEDVNGNNESLSTESSDAVEGGDSFDEWGDRRDYHLINAWSVIALVLALLSSAALLLPIFWIVPLLAIAASLIALAKIRREPHLYIGYRMAVIDLVGADKDEAVIDCGEDADIAMAALRTGWRRLLFSGRGEVCAKLAQIAEQQGASVTSPDQ